MSAVGWVAVVCWATAAALLTAPAGVGRLKRDEGRFAVPEWAKGRSDGFPWRLRLGISLGATGIVSLVFEFPVWSLVPVCVAVGVPLAVLLGKIESPQSRRRTMALRMGLPQACDLLSACLDAGLALRAATRVVAEAVGGPMGEELRRVTTRTDLGVSDEEAWDGLDHPVLRRLGRDMARCSRAGIVSSENLRAHAADASMRARAAREQDARRVGVRSVMPLMVCFLPAFMLLGIVPIVGGFVGSFLG